MYIKRPDSPKKDDLWYEKKSGNVYIFNGHDWEKVIFQPIE